jgi:hypothetical protein
VSLQTVSSRLLKLARDNQLWRSKCFDRSPSAATSANARFSGPVLSGLLREAEANSEETDEGVVAWRSAARWSKNEAKHRNNNLGRTRAIASWDLTNELERVDWYSDYIARHATLSVTWLDQGLSTPQEVRGLAISKHSTRAFGPLENGALCVWDVGQTAAGRLQSHRTFREISRSPASILFEDRTSVGEPFTNKARLEFFGPTE